MHGALKNKINKNNLKVAYPTLLHMVKGKTEKVLLVPYNTI